MDRSYLSKKILRILLDEDQIDEIRRQNIFNLLLTLGNSEPDFCLQVISRVVSYIFSEISNEGITFKILSYTNLFLDVLKIDIVRTMLSKEFKSKLGVPFALELNVVSAISLPTDNQLKFKEHAIDILKRTFASHEELTNILSEDNLNYFKKGSDISVSLRQKINQNYFKSVTEEVVLDVSHSDQESGQLMELVPALMPVEWRLVCRSDLGPRLIPIITELLFYLDIDSHVCYRVLRSLCSELKNSWTMLIQLIRLTHVLAQEDLKELLWSSIFANLSKSLQDGDENIIKEVLELFMSLDENQENVITATELILKVRNK